MESDTSGHIPPGFLTEDTWTPAREWCAKPHHWHAATADATEIEVTRLIAAFVGALQPDLVIETGTNTGQTSEAIGRALAANGHGRLVTCEIDTAMVWAARDRCKGLPVTVEQMQGVDYLPLEPVGFLFLDSHAHKRHLELEHFLPHLEAGAVIAVHDTASHHPVMDYLRPFIDAQRIVGLTLRTPRGVSFFQAP